MYPFWIKGVAMKLESIFDLCIKSNILCAEWDEKESSYTQKIKESQKLLVESLNEYQKNLFSSFRWDLESHLLNIRDEECMETFLLGFKFGRELQLAYDEDQQ